MPRHFVRHRLVAILLVAAALCLKPVATSAVALPGPLVELQQQLALMSARAPGNVGVIVKDLTTGLSTGINESANMPAASTIKIPVMVEVFRQMAAGDFDLNRAVTLQPSDRDAGWGDLVFARSGSRYRVQRLLQLMITESDNTATNMLIRLVGRAHINATMMHLGLRQTRLADYIRSDGDIRSLRTSPRDMTVLLDRMAHDELINPWSSRAMITILTGQRHNGLLPQPLPRGTHIAHKTGTLHDTLNDVGIVYLNDSPYIIAVLTTHLVTLDSGRQFIRGISRLAYDALAKFASWREANPLSNLAASALPAEPGQSPDVRMWMPDASESDEDSNVLQARPAKPPQPGLIPAESAADAASPKLPTPAMPAIPDPAATP